MNINFINNVATVYSTTSAISSPAKKTENSDETTDKTKFSKEAATYEKSEEAASKETSSTDRSAIVAQLNADLESQTERLFNIVRQSITGQGNALAKADDMWKFLASGNFEVDADVKAQAQADIAEDGYWGVNQTSDRILDFAKALSGGDTSKAETLIEAFKQGFDEATKAWGDTLPDISQRTYDAVLEKFEAWKNGDEAE
ncbi:MAG: hypothetical protein K6F30_09090 [Lachnospiraceae bacterium]|nr:hypothetical protein [Lachnospiraceae bacterium]